MKTLVLVFQKIESKDKTKYGNFYSSSKAEAITNESDIDNEFQSIQTTVIENIPKSSLKYSGCELLIQSLIILLVFQSIIF